VSVADSVARRRGALAAGAATIAAWLLIQVILPRATPPGILLLGVFQGLLTALAAAGIVLIYRTQGIINFAHFALGAAGAAILYEITTRGILPYAVALPLALLCGPVLGIAVGFVIVVLFFRHHRLIATVATFIIGGFVVGEVVTSITNAFRQPAERAVVKPFLGPFPEKVFLISNVPFRTAHLIGGILAVLVIVGMAVFFTRSRAGIAVRAAAENADRASLLGINVKALQIGMWGLAGLLSCTAAILALPVTGFNAASLGPVGSGGTELLAPFAAAVIGGMANIPVAMGAAFAMAVLREAVTWSFPQTAFVDIGFFAVILFGILLQRRQRVSARAQRTARWQGAKEVRPIPRELLRVPVVAAMRRVVIALVGMAVLAWPWLGGADLANFGSLVWILSIAGISLVVLTGWTGQISLGQFAFVAVGAFSAGVMTGRWDWSFWIATPLASMLGAVFAVIVGLPALRIRGLFLAVTTFGLAVVMPLLLFRGDFLGRFLPDEVRRPRLFFINFNDERSLYYFAVGIFALVALAVRALRRSRTGRVLIAIRDDPQEAQSFGINPVRAQLTAFALSGFLAAFAGAIFVHHQQGLSPASYGFFASAAMFFAVIVGGVSSIMGPVLGELFYQGANKLPEPYPGVLLGVGGLIVIMLLPGGLTQIVIGARDAVLRIAALRNRIMVPSLFADWRPESWERGRAPLAPAESGRGMAAFVDGRRYQLRSRLWGTPDEVQRALEIEKAALVWKAGPR
jgi:ABC-type branched-subunit amino acid transport system permease subunit